MKKVLEDIKRGDFSSFERLNDRQKGEIASKWTPEIQMAYLTRHTTMSEEEFFKKLDEIADGTFEG